MPFGLSSSEELLRQLGDKEFRDEFVADQVRSHIALMIRALRDQRDWSQTELGARAGKPQNVVSRLENPDYGKESLQTLLELAAAFDLPLWVEIPEWEDWLDRTKVVTKGALARTSYDVKLFCEQAAHNREALAQQRLRILQTGGQTAVPPAAGSEKVDGTEINLRLVSA